MVRSIQKTSSTATFSLMEAIIVVAILGVVAAVSFQAFRGTNEGSRLTKLESDAATVNQAAQVYTASGSLKGVTEPQAILDKMKTTRVGNAEEFAGNRSSMINKRLAARSWSPAQSGGSARRAVWNSAKNRFLIASSGTGGVGELQDLVDNNIWVDTIGIGDPTEFDSLQEIATATGTFNYVEEP